MSHSNEIFLSIVVYSLSALMAIAINTVFFLRARKTDLLRSFLNVQVIVIIWLLAKVLKKASPNVEIAWLWIVVQYVAVTMLGAIFLDFAYMYHKGHRLPNIIRHAVYMISGINYLAVFTNPLHHLYFTSFTIFKNEFGPWFYFSTAFTHILIYFCYYYLIRAVLGTRVHMPVSSVVIFILGILMPGLANISFLFGFVKSPIDPTPIMFNMTILVFGYSVYRYRFMDIRTVTRHMVLENIHEGILIIDSDNRILKVNNVVKNSIRNYDEISKISDLATFLRRIDNHIPDLEKIMAEAKKAIERHQPKYVSEIMVEGRTGYNTYTLKIERIEDGAGDSVGFVIRLIDVTRQIELLEGVEESNQALLGVNKQLAENITVAKRLAAAKERGRISKEIHDILGHSMTVVISLLEIAKGSIDDDLRFANEKVVQSTELIRSGLIELKDAMRKNLGDTMETGVLHDDLKRLIEDYEQSGIKVDFIYKEIDIKLAAKTYDAVYRVCQEGLTNALRHGHASGVTIALRYVGNMIDLVVIDDGIGCAQVKKGNGISGMANRVKALAGTFSCGSPEGQGFNIHVTLPI